jgi:beta-phosphoglucomutase-like phosphatase (HAD superfamily)
MPPIVLFELEGVLADTGASRRAALVHSLAEEHLTLDDHACTEACARRPVRAAVVAALQHLGAERDEIGIDLLTLRAERHFASRLGQGLSLVAGVHEMLDSLAARATLGVVSRAARREVEFVLGLAGLDATFACVIAAEDGTEQKPSPAPYRVALTRLARRGLLTAGALAVEDGLDGIRSAHAAGLPCIAVGDLPAHQAMEADGYIAVLGNLTHEGLEEMAARFRTRVA